MSAIEQREKLRGEILALAADIHLDQHEIADMHKKIADADKLRDELRDGIRETYRDILAIRSGLSEKRMKLDSLTDALAIASMGVWIEKGDDGPCSPWVPQEKDPTAASFTD